MYQSRSCHQLCSIWKSASTGDIRKVDYQNTIIIPASCHKTSIDRAFHSQVKVCVELEGIDVNSQDIQGSTALHIAAGLGHFKLVSYLISAGADRFARDGNGLAAMHVAARIGHIDIIKLLLEESDGRLSEDFDMKTYDGWTMLHCACRDGQIAVFEYLMQVMEMNSCSVRFPHSIYILG